MEIENQVKINMALECDLEEGRKIMQKMIKVLSLKELASIRKCKVIQIMAEVTHFEF